MRGSPLGQVAALLLAAAALVSGCGGGGGRAGRVVAAATPATPAPPTTQTHVFGKATWPHPAALQEVELGRYATSPLCARCHSASPQATAMRDGAGEAIGAHDLWQATMMANASRDPLWRAEVSVEVQATPAARAAIEAKCMSCHTPMASVHARSLSQPLRLALLGQDTPEAQLALDGVSCTHCHQIEADPANVAATFNGNERLTANKDLLGPHDQPQGTPMFLRTGYLPRKGDHVRSSAQCASCHTLYTTTLAPDGTPTGGTHPEQTAYLEWQNSVFDETRPLPAAEARSCQACHMPSQDRGAPLATKIARDNGGQDYPNLSDRAPVGRHLFVGGNTLVLSILRDNAADLRPAAPAAAFDAVIAATREQLRTRTATVSIAPAVRSGDALTLAVRVENLTGHKLPTGHPTRRLWLRLRVLDAQGRVVFASGEHDAAGRLVDATGRPLPGEAAGGPTYPHRDRVTAPDEVQVWEAVMRDRSGAPTWLLMRAEGYWKDDRLLPRGWDPSHPAAADTAPAGVAGDVDFGPGGDTVRYEVVAPLASGPYEVEATVLYQPLSARFAAELFRYATPEVEAFRAYYEAADRTPESVARAVTSAP
ncbi:MAG: cytochrome c family protein [Planctomycetes bacterium]|nr:cytochrome c family protein [Planctomycetota bacterium]